MDGNVTLNVWCGEMVECAKALHDLCHLHRVARERDNAQSQLDAVDEAIAPWWNKGMGEGRVQTLLNITASATRHTECR